MNEETANAVAALLGGRTWHSGGGLFLVVLDAPGGRTVALSDEAACEYGSEEEMMGGRAARTCVVWG